MHFPYRLLKDKKKKSNILKNKCICYTECGKIRIESITCNVPDLTSLGNATNVCVGSKVYNI
jgi:hypothetical protein